MWERPFVNAQPSHKASQTHAGGGAPGTAGFFGECHEAVTHLIPIT